ncbi:MAG: ABC transporter ATP-binding protein [Planctomycetes bacterium]|nr:ABC transporter ATP-binding protein [Planctomycetota bacterium]
MPPILQIRNLCKDFGALRAVNGVSLEVAQGEMFGLLGPNGAGKTTLLSIVAGLLEPSAGEVFIDGKRFLGRERDLKRLIGIVPQDLAIYGELTARENLRFFGQLYGLGDRALENRVDEILRAVGLIDRAGERVGTFSGGMKRRLNFGAGLVHEPRLLLLDEPTAGVDPQSRSHIFEEVRQRNAAGLTVVYTSHYMEEVQALCPRIGIIDVGKLVACDSLLNLLGALPGLIRFKVDKVSSGMRRRLGELGDVRDKEAQVLELECRAVKSTLVQLLAILTDEKVELKSLEMEEPNLERVFLHLTGRALRD